MVIQMLFIINIRTKKVPTLIVGIIFNESLKIALIASVFLGLFETAGPYFY